MCTFEGKILLHHTDIRLILEHKNSAMYGPITKLELHKKEPKKLELQKKEPSKLELHKLEPIQKRTL